MALIIEDPDLDEKIQTVAHALGKSVEETIRIALDRIEVPSVESSAEESGGEIDWPAVRQVLARADAKPIRDGRTADEILGYNERGHFD